MIEVEPLKLFFYNSLFGLIAAIGIATVTGQFMFVTDIRTHVFMFMGGVFTDMLGTVFMFKGVRKVGASKAAFLSVLEPGLSFVWDILFFGTKFNTTSLLGIALIFACFITMVFDRSRKII